MTLRPYRAADEEPAIMLWRRTWQRAYPDIDFSARLAWWRARWRDELVPSCAIIVAEGTAAATGDTPDDSTSGGRSGLAGFVTVDSATGYVDQIVVAPEAWGSSVAATLIGAAKRIAPCGLDLHVNEDNARAIRFYEKHGFAISGKDLNPRSGAPIYKMSWRTDAAAGA
jgi:putative acetyltransferase